MGVWGQAPSINPAYHQKSEFGITTLKKVIGGIVDRGVMIGAGAVILLVVFLLAKPFTEVIGASS
jgi:hypothetical protein